VILRIVLKINRINILEEYKMNEKKIFTESEMGSVSDTITDDLRKDFTVHQKARLFDEQNNFFVGFGYDGIQGFIDQCNQGNIMVMTTEEFKSNNKLKNQIIELKQQNKQLCKDADTFLKKKDSTNKIFQDLEFIKKIINTLQKEYNE
jgi:hypothetical protein